MMKYLHIMNSDVMLSGNTTQKRHYPSGNHHASHLKKYLISRS